MLSHLINTIPSTNPPLHSTPTVPLLSDFCVSGLAWLVCLVEKATIWSFIPAVFYATPNFSGPCTLQAKVTHLHRPSPFSLLVSSPWIFSLDKDLLSPQSLICVTLLRLSNISLYIVHRFHEYTNLPHQSRMDSCYDFVWVWLTCLFVETGSPYVALAGLELTKFYLPQHPECWD